MKNRIQRLLKKFGLELHRTDGAQSLVGALRYLRQVEIVPEYIIDGGASDGRWTAVARRIFPNARYILVEPLEEHLSSLIRLHPYKLIHGALSAQSGKTTLHVYNAENSSLIPIERASGEKRTVTAYTLADVSRGLRNILLKMDLEGMELSVLKTMQDLTPFVAIILECAVSKHGDTTPLFDEIVAYMSAHGFMLANVFNINYNPDGSLAQLDALFVPKAPLPEMFRTHKM